MTASVTRRPARPTPTATESPDLLPPNPRRICLAAPQTLSLAPRTEDWTVYPGVRAMMEQLHSLMSGGRSAPVGAGAADPHKRATDGPEDLWQKEEEEKEEEKTLYNITWGAILLLAVRR